MVKTAIDRGKQVAPDTQVECLKAAYETWTDHEQPVELRTAAAAVLKKLVNEVISKDYLEVEEGQQRTTLFTCGEVTCSATCLFTYGVRDGELWARQTPVVGEPPLKDKCTLPVQE